MCNLEYGIIMQKWDINNTSCMLSNFSNVEDSLTKMIHEGSKTNQFERKLCVT